MEKADRKEMFTMLGIVFLGASLSTLAFIYIPKGIQKAKMAMQPKPKVDETTEKV